MSTLDEFFREKLTNHSQAAPAGTWEKVEAGLSKKNNGLVWLRWAAALAVGTFLLGVLWMQRDGAPQIAQDQKVQPDQKPMVEKEFPQHPVADVKIERRQKRIEKQDANDRQPKKVLAVPREELKQELVSGNEHSQVREEEVMEDIKPVTETSAAAEQKSRPIVLTYTLDPVITASDAKEENRDASVMAETDKKSKGLKRMIDLANEVKNSESPLGELRLKKSELFALDLKRKPTSKKQ
jgi:hypothetical protein